MLEIKRSLRALVKRPAFAAVVVLTLALGIASSTAVFSIVNTVLLRPLPFADPDRLVQIDGMRGGTFTRLSLREVQDITERADVFVDVAAYVPGSQYSLTGNGAPEKPQAILMTHNLFSVLGVQLLYGETFPGAYDRSRFDAIVLSHDLWERQFGRNPAVVGTTIPLDSSTLFQTSYRIFGVLPQGFEFPAKTDLYRSLFINPRFPDHERRQARNVIAIARLEEGVSPEVASARIAAIGQQLAREFPETNTGLELRVRTVRDAFVGDVRPYVLVLLAAVTLVLLLACANIANLLLSRALARQQELAVRVALGASRARLVRQLLLEAMVLAFIGGAIGVVLAVALVRALVAFVRLDLPSWMTVRIDPVVLGFAFLISLIVGVIVGIVPALRATPDAIRRVSRGSGGSAEQRRLRDLLVLAEVALSLVLLVGAGLMLRTFSALLERDPGFASEGLLTFRMALPVRTPPEHTRNFQQQLLERLESIPGVTGAAINANLPLARVGQADYGALVAEGQSADEAARNPFVNFQRVTPGYFDVMRIPILAGRGTTTEDREGGLPIAVVSERVAKRLWPGSDPVGRRLVRESVDGRTELVIVGVAGDVVHDSLTADSGHAVYLSSRQFTDGWTHYVLRSAVDPQSIVPAVREAVAAIDRQQPVFDFQSMRERMLDTVWQQRVSALIFGVFAALALALAATGIYGVLSYLVTQRTGEIGVRMALGAPRERILREVLVNSLSVTGVGVLLGGVGAALLARAIRGLLFGVGAADMVTMIGAPAILILVATVAALIPAWRASRVDPIIALRAE